jgi:ABC-type amino acid transport substrate-binding protein
MFFLKAIARLILCTTTFLSYTAIANEPYVIKAALSQEFKEGLHQKYLTYVAKQLGMEIQITTMPFARRMMELKKGNLDIIVGLQFSNLRAEDLIFIFPAYEKLSFRYFTLTQNTEKIKSNNDLLGKTIGVIRGSKYFPIFEQNTELQKYSFNNLKTNIDMLMLGRIDIFVHYEESTALMLKTMKVDHLIAKTNHQPKYSLEHYLAISKNSPLVAKIEQLEKIVERAISQQDFIKLRLEHYQQNKH